MITLSNATLAGGERLARKPSRVSPAMPPPPPMLDALALLVPSALVPVPRTCTKGLEIVGELVGGAAGCSVGLEVAGANVGAASAGTGEGAGVAVDTYG